MAAVLDADSFRAAASLFPSGVTIVTTRGPDGRGWGFTASAFSSLSLRPPMILVCLDHAASCRRAFVSAERFAVNVLRPEHRELALRFATKEVDKFAAGGFADDAARPPVLEDALATLECKVERVIPEAGDHAILIGLVTAAHARAGDPMVHFRGRFHKLAPA
jgi:flavin reductase ActVB